jgi:hypothetical protein
VPLRSYSGLVWPDVTAYDRACGVVDATAPGLSGSYTHDDVGHITSWDETTMGGSGSCNVTDVRGCPRVTSCATEAGPTLSISRAYDLQGRITSYQAVGANCTFGQSANTTTWIYDDAARTVTITEDDAGCRDLTGCTYMLAPTRSVTVLSFDALGHLQGVARDPSVESSLAACDVTWEAHVFDDNVTYTVDCLTDPPTP